MSNPLIKPGTARRIGLTPSRFLALAVIDGHPDGPLRAGITDRGSHPIVINERGRAVHDFGVIVHPGQILDHRVFKDWKS